MRRFGTQQASEEWFEQRQPRIMSQDTYRGEGEDRPWYCSVGRDHGKAPLWMQQEVGCTTVACSDTAQPSGRVLFSQRTHRVQAGNLRTAPAKGRSQSEH